MLGSAKQRACCKGVNICVGGANSGSVTHGGGYNPVFERVQVCDNILIESIISGVTF